MVDLLDEIKKLSVEEQILLITKAWNNIPGKNAIAEKPSAAMRELLDARLESHRQNPDAGSSVDEVIARIRNRW